MTGGWNRLSRSCTEVAPTTGGPSAELGSSWITTTVATATAAAATSRITHQRGRVAVAVSRGWGLGPLAVARRLRRLAWDVPFCLSPPWSSRGVGLRRWAVVGRRPVAWPPAHHRVVTCAVLRPGDPAAGCARLRPGGSARGECSRSCRPRGAPVQGPRHPTAAGSGAPDRAAWPATPTAPWPHEPVRAPAAPAPPGRTPA